MTDNISISLTGLEPITPYGAGRPVHKVTFSVTRMPHDACFTVPIVVGEQFDDGQAVNIARAYLHNLFGALAADTKKWALTDGQVQDARLGGKTL